MKNISLELLPLLPSLSSFLLCLDVKGYNYSSDTEAERVNLLLLSLPPPSLFFLSAFFLIPFPSRLFYRLIF